MTAPVGGEGCTQGKTIRFVVTTTRAFKWGTETSRLAGEVREGAAGGRIQTCMKKKKTREKKESTQEPKKSHEWGKKNRKAG